MKEFEQPETINFSHSVFQQVHNHSAISVIAVNAANIIVYANTQSAKSFGFSNKQFINHPFTGFFTDESAEQYNLRRLSVLHPLENQEFRVSKADGKELCVLISSAVLIDIDKITYTYLFIRDISPLKKKENLLAYLNKATEELALTRDTQGALAKISKLIVPKFANWFAIDILKENKFELLVLAHDNPDKKKWAIDYRKNYPTDLNSNYGIAKVIKTGIPSFVPVITEEIMQAAIADPDQLKALQMIGMQSLITVAMPGKDKIAGVISFISATPGNYYDEADLRFAQSLANHIGLTLENTRLNEDAANEIAHRKKIEERLQITQTQLQAALSSGLVGTWITDMKRNILYPDESLSAMFGIPFYPDGCRPEIFEEALHPADRQKAIRKQVQAAIEGQIFETEYRVLKGESTQWFFARGKIEPGDGNRAELFTGVVIDITARKQAEMALRESEERYSAAFSNASVGILMADLNGRLIKANLAFTAITGYTETDLLNKNFSITHPDDQEKQVALYKQLFNQEIPNFIFEKRYIHKNGYLIWVRNSTSLVMDANKNPVYTFSIIEDITGEKYAKMQLEKSEGRFRLLAETMPQKVFFTDSAGNLEYLNPQWEQFTGMSTKEIERLTLAYFIHPDDLEQNLELWFEATATGKNFIYEHRFLNKDGQYIWHLTRALPLKDENGNIVRWIGTMTDINDQKENEEKKDEFISIASHELKTPLTTIKVFFQLIKKEMTPELRSFNFAGRAARQLGRLERLIEDLLDVSKINAGKMQYNLENFNFREALEEAIESVQETTEQHQIVLEAFDDIPFYGDRYRIEQVVVNLLNNAIKYSPNADKVIVNCQLQNHNLTVSVKDFGIGISDQHKSNLFKRFYRVDNTSSRFQGLGLGLFISSEIIQRHDGTFWVESEPGKGSVFYFLLPLETKKEFKAISVNED
jgi:PAS domain S-box-containing protein